jgi:hypothetical protein
MADAGQAAGTGIEATIGILRCTSHQLLRWPLERRVRESNKSDTSALAGQIQPIDVMPPPESPRTSFDDAARSATSV